MDIAKQIASELSIRTGQAEAVINLIDEGNTIPFIARYRKEAHGSLDDEQIRNINERLVYLRNLEEKKPVLMNRESLQRNLESRFWKHRHRLLWKTFTAHTALREGRGQLLPGRKVLKGLQIYLWHRKVQKI